MVMDIKNLKCFTKDSELTARCHLKNRCTLSMQLTRIYDSPDIIVGCNNHGLN